MVGGGSCLYGSDMMRLNSWCECDIVVAAAILFYFVLASLIHSMQMQSKK